MHQVVLILGGNLKNRKKLLADALLLVNDEIGKTLKSSSIYETEAWAFKTKSHFLNQVVLAETILSPEAVLKRAQGIEKKLGREKGLNSGYASRTMDIDILFYDDQVISTKELSIPHPLMHKRRFVLEPLNEIAATFMHPKLQLTISELLQKCEDNHRVALA